MEADRAANVLLEVGARKPGADPVVAKTILRPQKGHVDQGLSVEVSGFEPLASSVRGKDRSPGPGKPQERLPTWETAFPTRSVFDGVV